MHAVDVTDAGCGGDRRGDVVRISVEFCHIATRLCVAIDRRLD